MGFAFIGPLLLFRLLFPFSGFVCTYNRITAATAFLWGGGGEGFGVQVKRCWTPWPCLYGTGMGEQGGSLTGTVLPAWLCTPFSLIRSLCFDTEWLRAAEHGLAARDRRCQGLPGKAPVGAAAGCGKGLGTADAQTRDLRSPRPSGSGEEMFPFCLDDSSCVGDVPDTHELVFKDWCFLLLLPKKTSSSSYKLH